MARGRDVYPHQIEISLGQPTQRVQHPKNVPRHKLAPVQTAQITRHWVPLCFSSQAKCGQIQGETPSGELLQPGPALDSISCCWGAGCCSLCPSAKTSFKGTFTSHFTSQSVWVRREKLLGTSRHIWAHLSHAWGHTPEYDPQSQPGPEHGGRTTFP